MDAGLEAGAGAEAVEQFADSALHRARVGAQVAGDGAVGQACREQPEHALSSSPGPWPGADSSPSAWIGIALGSDGSVTSELDWSQSGGGQSWVEPEPTYQDGVQQSGFRDLPDVSYDADPNTGVAVYDSLPFDGQSGWWVVGGTSLGAPSWSAVLADADQLRGRGRGAAHRVG